MITPTDGWVKKNWSCQVSVVEKNDRDNNHLPKLNPILSNCWRNISDASFRKIIEDSVYKHNFWKYFRRNNNFFPLLSFNIINIWLMIGLIFNSLYTKHYICIEIFFTGGGDKKRFTHLKRLRWYGRAWPRTFKIMAQVESLWILLKLRKIWMQEWWKQ